MSDVEADRQRAEVFDALGHPTRIAVLKALSAEPMGFADLKKAVGIDSSGHLQHHLNKLDTLIKTDEHGKYCLSDQGKDALLTVQTVEKAARSGIKETERRRASDVVSKNFLKSVALLLSILLVASSVVAILEYTQIAQLQAELKELREKITPGTSLLWERDFGVNINGFSVVGEKVFVTTYAGYLYCLDQENGKTLWEYNFGPLAGGGFLTAPVVADGKVFVGSRGSKLTALGENNGSFLWQFQPNVSSSYASKSPPLFTVVDGKVFTTGDGFYVLNASDGKLIWGYEGQSVLSLREFEWVAADGRVFIAGIENDWYWYLYSLNADNGQISWKYKIFTNLESPPVVADGRVLVWDRWQNQTILCLNATLGSLLWEYDVGAEAFQPTVANGLVLFGASDGNFYALNESDGTLKWSYKSKYVVNNYPAAAAPIVTNNEVIVGYEAGYVTVLTLSDGQLVWRAPVAANVGSLEVGNNSLYVTSGTNLYSIKMDNGSIQWKQTFNYWTLPPVYSNSRLFVAADLKVIAYG